MTAKELRAARADLIMKAKAILNGESVTDEQMIEVDRMHAEGDSLKQRIDAVERSDSLSAELNTAFAARVDAAPASARAGVSRDPAEARADAAAREGRILRAHLLGNVSSLPEEDRALFAAGLNRFMAAGQGTGNAAGGYTIAPEWSNELLVAMKTFGGMRQVARNYSTASGASLPFPTLDDTAQTGSIVSENTQITQDTDLTFGNITLGSFTYKTGLMTVSLQLLNDSAFDFNAVVRDAMARRLATIQNTHFTVGTGTGQPQGVVVGATSGKVGLTGQTLTVITDDLIDLEHSVDPSYRAGARFMMNDSTFKTIKKLKDTQNRPLFLPGFTVGAADTILGYPITINQDVAVMAANAKSILFGNFTNYIIRDVVGVEMVVLRERYADFLQVGYIAFQRSDGKLVSAAAPVKTYSNSAT